MDQFKELKIKIQKEIRPYSGLFDETATFGIEIEFTVPVALFPDESGDTYSIRKINYNENKTYRMGSYDGCCFVANKLSEITGYSFIGANHYGNNYSHWQIKSDCSVKPLNQRYIGGFELASPVLSGLDGLVKITKVCKALKTIGGKTNPTCGTHVHYGIGSFFEGETEIECYPSVQIEKVDYICKNIADTYLEYEAVIDKFVDPNRLNNGYCRTLRNVITASNIFRTNAGVTEINFFNFLADSYYPNYSIGEISPRSLFLSDRYYKVNFSRLERENYQTVEIRQLEGTLDAKKICTWVFLHQLIHKALSRGVENRTRSKDFDDLLSYLQWDDNFCGNDREIKKAVKNLRSYGNCPIVTNA